MRIEAASLLRLACSFGRLKLNVKVHESPSVHRRWLAMYSVQASRFPRIPVFTIRHLEAPFTNRRVIPVLYHFCGSGLFGFPSGLTPICLCVRELFGLQS